MDTQGLLPPPVKPKRRTHSRQFKEQVVAASHQPGLSVAGVAQQFGVNANLVHKWRRQSGRSVPALLADFIKLEPAVSRVEPESESKDVGTLRVELVSQFGVLTLHWPMDQLDRLSSWLRTSA